MKEQLEELLREVSSIQSHLDNDLLKTMPHWSAEANRVFRELADYYNREIYDGE